MPVQSELGDREDVRAVQSGIAGDVTMRPGDHERRAHVVLIRSDVDEQPAAIAEARHEMSGLVELGDAKVRGTSPDGVVFVAVPADIEIAGRVARDAHAVVEIVAVGKIGIAE